MNILFQDKLKDTVEILLLKEIIDKNDLIHSCVFISIDDLDINRNKNYEEFIPIGSIEFVSKWFKEYKNIDNMIPLEIPYFFQTNEFLKREYKFVNYFDLPEKGLFFIKDASVLKNGSYSGYMEDFKDFKSFNLDKNHQYFKDFQSFNLDKNHQYIVSEFVKILSEYRIYVIDGKIENITNYNGDISIFPDIDFIKKVDHLWKRRVDYPKSYSFDVMITDKGTSLIEFHAFTCLGLYSTIWSDNLLYAYRDGINFYLKHHNKNSFGFRKIDCD